MADHPARVIVGVDGSDGSLEALPWAAREAGRRGAELHVVTCAQLPVTVESGLIGAGAFAGSSMDAIIDEHKEINQQAVDQARGLGLDIIVSGETVLGAPGYALVSATHDHDLLVVGATSHPGKLTDLLGSVATVATHRARGPVVVVHGTGHADRPLRRVVVGVDGSAAGDEALAWATEAALAGGAELVLVHGWVYPYSASRAAASEPRDDMRLDAMRLLESCTVKAHELAPALVCQAIISEESPAKAILDAAADADLVVVGSRGHGGFAALLLGSVSRTVLQHSPCPVAVVRGPH